MKSIVGAVVSRTLLFALCRGAGEQAADRRSELVTIESLDGQYGSWAIVNFLVRDTATGRQRDIAGSPAIA